MLSLDSQCAGVSSTQDLRRRQHFDGEVVAAAPRRREQVRQAGWLLVEPGGEFGQFAGNVGRTAEEGDSTFPVSAGFTAALADGISPGVVSGSLTLVTGSAFGGARRGGAQNFS